MIIHQIPNSYGNYNYNAYIYTQALWESHFHGNYELIFGMEGITEVSLNGVKYTLFPEELILISPYTIHSLQGINNSKIWVGVFSEDYIVCFSEKNRFTDFIKFRCDNKITEILKEYLFYQGKPEHYLLISCLYMICNECIKNPDFRTTKKDNEFMFEIIRYISENLSQDITMKETARRLNYEYHYFSSLFHKCFCMNFKSFVNMFRFESACRLLGNKSESITLVCSKCGFGSIRNLNRVFKQLSGLTPSEYRKKV